MRLRRSTSLVYAATRLSSLGSLLGVWSFPVFASLLGGVPRAYVALSIGTAVLVTMRHRANLQRLWRGEEKRA